MVSPRAMLQPGFSQPGARGSVTLFQIDPIPSSMNIVRAVSLKLASTMMFALMSAQGRYLGGTFPVGEIVFFRGLFALIPIVIFFGYRRELRGALQTNRLSAHFVRGLFSVCGTFCTFGALARLPIADLTAIAFIAPLIT